MYLYERGQARGPAPTDYSQATVDRFLILPSGKRGRHIRQKQGLVTLKNTDSTPSGLGDLGAVYFSGFRFAHAGAIRVRPWRVGKKVKRQNVKGKRKN